MIDVVWTPGELEDMAVQERPAVLIDVLRASTTMTVAIHNGARAVVPVASTEEAMRIANSLGREEVLLCGERGGVRIEGFDLGNSPAEFAPDIVRGRTIIMTTTNGTRTLKRMTQANAVFVAAFINLTPAARALASTDGEPLIVCAGREGRVGVEDALCAGMLLDKWLTRRRKKPEKTELGDGAIASLALARAHAPVDAEFLQRTAAGRALEQVGLGSDLELCAQIDKVKEVPVLRENQIRPLEPAKA